MSFASCFCYDLAHSVAERVQFLAVDTSLVNIKLSLNLTRLSNISSYLWIGELFGFSTEFSDTGRFEKCLKFGLGFGVDRGVDITGCSGNGGCTDDTVNNV